MTHPDRLSEPLRWRKPQVVCVAFLGDLFHEAVPDDFINAVWATFGATKHTYLVLTKRPQRMLRWCEDHPLATHRFGQPLPNVWLGLTVEDQRTADERIPLLLQTPAVHRWISVEPMLGAVQLRQSWRDYLDGWDTEAEAHYPRGGGAPEPVPIQVQTHKLDWVCLGGESGPEARPMHPAWVRDVRDQCAAAGVPYYHKQNGEYIECEKRGHIGGEHYAVDPRKRTMIVYPDGHSFEYKSNWDGMDDGIAMERVGTAAAGHLLDGREHRELLWGKR